MIPKTAFGLGKILRQVLDPSLFTWNGEATDAVSELPIADVGSTLKISVQILGDSINGDRFSARVTIKWGGQTIVADAPYDAIGVMSSMQRCAARLNSD